MTKLCPNGHEVNDKLNFCPQCGVEFGESTAMFCIKCGNKRKGTDKFCSQCGTPFGVSPMSGNNKTPKKSSKKGLPKVVWSAKLGTMYVLPTGHICL